MRRLLQISMLAVMCAGTMGGEIIDRVVATVNGQPILQSDWEVAMRCEALLDQRPLQFTPESARGTLERLVDQELLRQQIRSFQLKPADESQVRSRLEEIRKQIPGAVGEEGWKAALDRYGLTQKEVEDRVADQVEMLRFIDIRLRPTVHVDRRNITAYYNEKLLPELKEKGATPVPLAEVSQQIEEILSQQLIDAQLAELLRDLRQQSDIHIDSAILPAETASTTTQVAR
jgi:hypothetical protein